MQLSFLLEFEIADWGPVNATDWPGPEKAEDRADLPRVCYFKGQRKPSEGHYEYNEAWFHILAAKLAFVFVFEVLLATTG